ncbi:MAG: DegT/DnrJ/EryC1/StrS family aminotransferase [Candidatus Kariarchaeaceae archaeon]|jgi:dTDP-4-amino-4,6-dideoxygalactose transaminase
MKYSYKVRFVNYPEHYRRLKSELDQTYFDIMNSGDFILRQHLEDFEQNFADFIGVKYGVGVNSGTDALFFSVRAAGIGEGDEVITVSHTFLATVGAIVNNHATPVLIDVAEDHNMDVTLIEKAITPKTKAIIPVHLNGRICNMEMIMEIAEKYDLIIIEDAAQALGATFKNKKAGSFGLTSIYSFYPAKVLGTAGDGGMLCTDSEKIAIQVRELRDNGRTSTGGVNGYGYCSRLDNLHAALLDVKLKHIPSWIKRRREIADQYKNGLNDISELHLPHYSDDRFLDVYQNYVIQTSQRDDFVKNLRESGIEILISWPIPMHKQESLNLNFNLPVTENISNTVVSLPMFPELSDDEVQTVIDSVRGFFKG